MTDNASILECWLQRRTGVTTASKTEILEVEGVQSDLREINLLRQIMNKFAISAAVAVCLLAVNSASSQEIAASQPAPLGSGRSLNWAEQLFDRERHDFGVVARGAEVVVRMKITNK
jgi:hypothetical protein